MSKCRILVPISTSGRRVPAEARPSVLCRRAGRPGVCVLRPDGPGALQTHAQHRGEADRQVRRQAVFLPQQGGRSRQRNGQTGESSTSTQLTSDVFNNSAHPECESAASSRSLQRVMMQIVQELCRRPGLNKCGFEMPTIYIPNPQKVSFSSISNYLIFAPNYAVPRPPPLPYSFFSFNRSRSDR